MSSPVDPSSPITIRKRSDTKTLLGNQYTESPTALPDPPLPLKEAVEYTQEVLIQRLNYAHCALNNPRRILSPLGVHAVKLYKEACARLLDLEDGEVLDNKELEEARAEWISTLRTYEESIQYRGYLKLTHSDDAVMLQQQLVSLQRTSFYARYGDYFADVCSRLKREAAAHQVAGWQHLQKSYWTEIYNKLTEERTAFQRVRAGEMAHEGCPTHIAISQACDRVGFDMDPMLSAIEHYAVRNELVHANLLALIKDGRYHKLAKTLHDDFCDLPRLISSDVAFPSKLLLTLLQSLIDLWFDLDEDDYENYEGWSPKPNVKALRRELREGQEALLTKKVSGAITKEVQKRLRDAEKVKEVLDRVDKFSVSPGPQRKRVASSRFEEEKKEAKKMKVAWDKIVGLSAGLRSMSDTYLLEYGELAPPPELIPDPSLDDE